MYTNLEAQFLWYTFSMNLWKGQVFTAFKKFLSQNKLIMDGVVAQQVTSQCSHSIQAPVRIPASPFLTQPPADGLGKQESPAQDLAPWMGETQKKLLAPAFESPQLWLLWPVGAWTSRLKISLFLFFPLSLFLTFSNTDFQAK